MTRRRLARLAPLGFALALLAGCAGHPKYPPSTARASPELDEHVPAFARKPYEPFSREDAVAIALREWRLFGQPVDDDPPDSRPQPPPDQMPEREPGLWQRVGEYWWIGMDPGSNESLWTGKHDEYGSEFPAPRDGDYAWSAAFISYIMRIDGAGSRFPYSESHSDYINAAARESLGQGAGYAIRAERPSDYAPQLGDLICTGRDGYSHLKFDDLPTGKFFSHCDMVVQIQPGTLSVIGGNVDDAVTLKHVPITADGKLAGPDGVPLDPRYPWFVVLRVLYDR
jgi:hypothetical protein